MDKSLFRSVFFGDTSYREIVEDSRKSTVGLMDKPVPLCGLASVSSVITGRSWREPRGQFPSKQVKSSCLRCLAFLSVKLPHTPTMCTALFKRSWGHWREWRQSPWPQEMKPGWMLGTDLKEIIFEYKERFKKKKSQMLENQNVRKPRREEKREDKPYWTFLVHMWFCLPPSSWISS